MVGFRIFTRKISILFTISLDRSLINRHGNSIKPRTKRSEGIKSNDAEYGCSLTPFHEIVSSKLFFDFVASLFLDSLSSSRASEGFWNEIDKILITSPNG